jgi:hypothetical protein
MDLTAQIRSLHLQYVQLTGLKITLSMDLMQSWERWMVYNKEDPFTDADLCLVVRGIQVGLKKGKRNPGALKFDNLIENPRGFDQDRAQYRSERTALARQPKVNEARESVLRATGRTSEQQDYQARNGGEIARRGLEALKNFDKP